MGGSRKSSSQRSFVFLASLVGVLCLTSVLLMCLAPAPLSPDASTSLYAAEESSRMDAIFRTDRPVVANTWKYIYIHHSKTVSATEQTGLGDHFLIGNGQGQADGQILIERRWDQQVAATAPPDATLAHPSSVISICLVGDLDQSPPTAMQVLRLTRLVQALQARFDIPSEQVAWIVEPGLVAAAGRQFPSNQLRAQLLP